MRKIISIMMIMLVLVGAVYAGGSSDKSASSQSQSGKTVVNIWTNDRHDAEYLNEKIAEFNASNQDIEIKMTTVVEDYPNMLVMSYTSGNAPDLFYMNARGTGFDLKTFVDAGMLVPYPDSLLNDPDFEKVTDASKHIVEGINAINGVPYAIFSVLRSGTRMIYNMDLLEQAGITELPATEVLLRWLDVPWLQHAGRRCHEGPICQWDVRNLGKCQPGSRGIHGSVPDHGVRMGCRRASFDGWQCIRNGRLPPAERPPYVLFLQEPGCCMGSREVS